MEWIKSKKIKLNTLVGIVLIIVASLLTSALMIYLSPESAKDFFETVKQYPMLFVLNYLPVIVVMLLIYFMFNNAILSIALSVSLFLSLSIIDRIKISMRQDPFIPTDLSLATEVTAILDKFDPSFVKFTLGIIAAIIIVVLISVLFFKGSYIKPSVRAVACAAIIVIGFLLNFTLYSSESLYSSFPVTGNIYFKVNHYVAKGFLYSFLHDANTLSVKKPIGYNPEKYKQLENDIDKSDINDSKKPHIIMIMGEAFSDLSENENLSFSDDPLENYKKISADDNSLSGHIIVPNFGGGTSDTEFDVLSACPTRYINNSMPSYSFVRKNFDSMPNLLKGLGYNTLAIHPGYSWFYNRINVYNYMGFEDFKYLENSFDEKTQNKGNYISEKVTIDTIISEFDKHSENSDNPLFEFCVTIQNHGPYAEKYLETPLQLKSKVSLSKEENDMLTGYFNGVSDADKELGRLVSYFESSDEPVVLVYFGDHLPGFPNGMDFFDILNYNIDINGDAEQRLNVYKTPFLIWQNDSSKELTGIKNIKDALELPNNNTISANYLGAALFELLGYNNVSALFDFSNELRKELPIITNQSFMDKNSNYMEEVSAEQLPKIDLLKGWVFYKLFDQN